MATIRIHKKQALKLAISLISFFVLYIILNSFHSSLTSTSTVITYNNRDNQIIFHQLENEANNTFHEALNQEFINYESIKLNGVMGKPFLIDPNTLNLEDKKDYDEGWKLNTFNRYASDRIPLNRTLPDVRLPR